MFAFEIKFSTQEQWNKSRWKLNSVKRRRKKKLKIGQSSFYRVVNFFLAFFFYLHVKNFFFSFFTVQRKLFLPQMSITGRERGGGRVYQRKEMKNYRKVSLGTFIWAILFVLFYEGNFWIYLNFYAFIMLLERIVIKTE